jgi:N-acetylglucosamine-6-phosphate deacetylase
MNKYKVSFTHLYNAMSANNHRKPGVLSAALLKGKFAEIICDMNHVSKESILIAKKCIPDLYAITDSISACGLSNGDYKFAEADITKTDKKVVIKGSGTLAGSIVNMYETFLNLLKINLPMEDVVKMTSFSAAKYLNDDTIGYIKEGYRSNFLVLDKDLNIEKIFLNGNLVND